MFTRSFTGFSTSSSTDRPPAETAGEILDRTFRLYRRHAWTFLRIASLPAAAGALIAAVAQPFAPTSDLIATARSAPQDVFGAAAAMLSALILGQAMCWALYGAGQGMAALVVCHVDSDEMRTSPSLWTVVTRRAGSWVMMIGALLALYTTCGLLVIGGSVAAVTFVGLLLAMAAPGAEPIAVAAIGIGAAMAGGAAGAGAAIWVLLRWSLAPTRHALDDGGVRWAFASSARLTRRLRGRTLGVLFVTGLIHVMAVLILQAPFVAAGLILGGSGTPPVWSAPAAVLAAGIGTAATLPPIWIGLALLERTLSGPPET